MKKIIVTVLYILQFAIASAQYTKLYNFIANPDGWVPKGALISDGTFLFGTTRNGGTSANGTLFKIKPDGTGYLRIKSFLGADGKNPSLNLTYDGNFLYGMTSQGGRLDKGTIFKIKPDGTGFDSLMHFNGVETGAYPLGSFYYDGTFLYGYTAIGGTNSATNFNTGTIFKIKPNGTNYVKLFDFTIGGNVGKQPISTPVSDGVNLYGITQGSAGYNGTIFKINKDGTGFSNLFTFPVFADGIHPTSLLYVDGFLYGTTNRGGSNDRGVLFKIKTDGTSYSKIMNFIGSTTGNSPYEALIYDGTFFYGMTNAGGNNDYGVIYKIKPDGTGFNKIFDFTAQSGISPQGSLFAVGSTLYGTTSGGGTNAAGGVINYGVVFKVEGSGFLILPVKLLSFIGQTENEKNKLTWQTTSETNSSHFEIQNSNDGINFKKIGIVQSNGNNNATALYHFTDSISLNGNNYYRLKMVDKNGEFEFSKTILLKSGINKVLISIYPNPSTNIINIASYNNIKQLQLFDISGRKISEWKTPPSAINVNNIANGTYILKAQLKNGENVEQKVVIQK